VRSCGRDRPQIQVNKDGEVLVERIRLVMAPRQILLLTLRMITGSAHRAERIRRTPRDQAFRGGGGLTGGASNYPIKR